jgi:hypothetical protein
VAVGNLDGDSEDEIVTGAGPGGGPHVQVWNVGANGTITPGVGFMAYAPAFTGGVTVAVGDVNGDGKADIITGAGAGGGPHVRVFNQDGSLQNAGFMAYGPDFTGGVDVAAGNMDDDPAAEIITGAGAGGGPHVREFNVDAAGNGATPIGGGFMAYGPSFTGGVRVASGDFDSANNSTASEIVTGPGAGGGPHVRVFNADGSARGGGFMAYSPSFPGGVDVAVGNVVGTSSSAKDIITGAGPGGGPHVAVFSDTGSPLDGGYFAFESDFSGGVAVAAGNVQTANNEFNGGEVIAGTYRSGSRVSGHRFNH